MVVSKRITRVTPWQEAKVSAALYFLFGLVFAVPMAAIAWLVPTMELSISESEETEHSP